MPPDAISLSICLSNILQEINSEPRVFRCKGHCSEIGELSFNLKISLFLSFSPSLPKGFLSTNVECASVCWGEIWLLTLLQSKIHPRAVQKVNMSVFSVLGWFESECEYVTGDFTLGSWPFSSKELCYLLGSWVHLQMLACWVVFADQNSLLAET